MYTLVNTATKRIIYAMPPCPTTGKPRRGCAGVTTTYTLRHAAGGITTVRQTTTRKYGTRYTVTNPHGVATVFYATANWQAYAAAKFGPAAAAMGCPVVVATVVPTPAPPVAVPPVAMRQSITLSTLAPPAPRRWWR
jgi:acyl-CoA reductase-like NAD-dependent aldehyde dehydrogenase